MLKTNNKSINYFWDEREKFSWEIPLDLDYSYGMEVLKFYADLFSCQKSALNTENISYTLENELAKMKEFIPLIYQNLYYLAKRVLTNDEVRIVENEMGFEAYTKDLANRNLPIFTFTSNGIFESTTVDFYHSAFNSDLRESTIISLLRYKNYLLQNGAKYHDEIIIFLDSQIDDLLKRREEPNQDDLDLMALQLKYHQLLFQALGIDDTYFNFSEITYLKNGSQKLVRRNNLGKTIISDNKLYF